jgi:hypothetical protein
MPSMVASTTSKSAAAAGAAGCEIAGDEMCERAGVGNPYTSFQGAEKGAGGGMKLSPDLTRYVVRAGIVAIGTLLAVLDRRWIGRRVFAVLLVTH